MDGLRFLNHPIANWLICVARICFSFWTGVDCCLPLALLNYSEVFIIPVKSSKQKIKIKLKWWNRIETVGEENVGNEEDTI